MPGIFGLAGLNFPANARETFGAMAARMKHFPWYLEDHYVGDAAGIALGRVALGFVNNATQPAWNEDRSLLAVMDGELYDAAEQCRRLTALGHRFRTDSQAELLLHGYEQEGQTFFRGLNGKFSAAIWDVGNRRLILTNDRFGMK